jgi:putative ATP-binding cassette transporter
LNEDEKQSLAFARVLLQRPRWLVMDGALDKLEPALRRRIEALLAGEPNTALVNIGPDSSPSHRRGRAQGITSMLPLRNPLGSAP